MTRRLVLLALGLFLLAAQARLRPLWQAHQQEAGLVMASRGGTGMSADAAVPVLALGAFRGLLIDYLWLRAITLREQGRHHEARQLAEQICTLQPRMWEVWSYMGHDLAYNVATAVDDPEERWRWVQNGITLLRDRGIRWNPDAPELYFQLARTFEDKIASTRDDFHKRFKEQHARAMLAVLGDPQVDLAALAAAPPWDALLEGEPAARELVAALDAEDPRARVLELEALRRDPERLERAGLSPALREQLEAPVWERLVLAARAALCRERFALDPARMEQLDREWGPLDWRGVDATTIYWAAEGLRVAREREILARQREMQRVTLTALKYALNGGRIQVFPDGLFFAPMIELVPKVEALTRESVEQARARQAELLAQRDAPRGGLTPAEWEELNGLEGFLNNQASAREDFLVQAIQLLHDYGREKAARELYATAQREYPAQQEFQRDYDAFLNLLLAKRFVDPDMMFETHVTISQLVEGCWVAAYKALALGQDEKYRSMRRIAEAGQARWQRYLASQTGLDPRVRQRLDVPFEGVRQRAIFTAGRQLTPFLRRRLAERAGIDPALLEAPPKLDLPPAARGGE